jgi:subtilisin family serine protease
VDGAHEDLAGQVLTNPGETGAGRESNSVDDDGNGYVDDWRGWDFAYGDNDPSDLDGHGTNVAGIVAARNGNGKGGSGLAPDARVLNLKALNDTGSGDWSEIAEAFDYAGRAGVRVVNASLGGDGYVPVIDNTVAQWPDTLYVVSAGNDSLDLDTTTYYPCEAAPENVLCVGASDNRDEKPGFSNFSPTAVDVFAPGVLALGPAQGSYFYYSGTSQAAPHVSALAALLLARDGSLTAAQVKQAIIDSAEPRAQLAAYGRGGGRANAQVALDLLSAPGGSDTDGDGVLDGADSCPDTAGVAWLAGCPLPATPPPDPPSTGQAPGNSGGGGGQGGGGGVPPEPAPARLTRIDVSARGGKVNVRVRTSRPVSVRVAAQRKVCRAGRCTWKTVRTARVSRTGKAKLRLAAGRYRLQVSALGAATRYRAVTVRG